MIPPPPPPPPPQYRSVNQVIQYQKQQQYDDNSTKISAVTDGGSIIGGRDDQRSLRIRNNNCQVQNVLLKRMIRRSIALSETAPNTYATNESDTNYDMCCLGKNFIPIAYINCTSDLYTYSDAY